MRLRCLPVLVPVAAAAAFALLAAGCGGGSAGVASVSSSTAAVTPPQSGAVLFARCMRSHGVPGFPDPKSDGAFDANRLKQLDVGKARMRAATTACIHLLPDGVVPTAPRYTITRADQADYLRAAACMRRHGFPGFPDPTFDNGGVQLAIPSSIDTSSTRFRSAAAICTKLIPAGLPYTKPSGS
jgi:hypothetical protein